MNESEANDSRFPALGLHGQAVLSAASLHVISLCTPVPVQLTVHHTDRHLFPPIMGHSKLVALLGILP